MKKRIKNQIITEQQREKESIRLKLQYSKQKPEWEALVEQIILNPDVDVKPFSNLVRYKQKAMQEHLSKLKILVAHLEIGRYYHKDDLIDLLSENGYQVTRPGCILFKAFEALYYEDTKTYYIIKQRILNNVF